MFYLVPKGYPFASRFISRLSLNESIIEFVRLFGIRDVVVFSVPDSNSIERIGSPLTELMIYERTYSRAQLHHLIDKLFINNNPQKSKN